jgi:serine phosphatase RsbU (regulator of sigma subunit)
MYATAQIAEIDTNSRTMRMVNAGHPFPILRRANGAVELLVDARGPLLGLSTEPSSRRRSATWSFDTGDALLLYTDGLIERRRQSIDVGMQLLVDAMSEHGGAGTAADLVDRVLAVSTMGGDTDKTDDDVALLVVRLLDDAVIGPAPGPLPERRPVR